MSPLDFLWGALAFVATLGGLGVVPLLVWMDHRHKQRMKQMEIDEQQRLLERGEGEHLRQLARAGADKERSRAIGAIGVAVGISLSIGGLLASMPIAERRNGDAAIPLLAVLWVAIAAAQSVTVVCCVRALRRPVGDEPRYAPPLSPRLPDVLPERHPGSTAIHERAEK